MLAEEAIQRVGLLERGDGEFALIGRELGRQRRRRPSGEPFQGAGPAPGAHREQGVPELFDGIAQHGQPDRQPLQPFGLLQREREPGQDGKILRPGGEDGLRLPQYLRPTHLGRAEPFQLADLVVERLVLRLVAELLRIRCTRWKRHGHGGDPGIL